MAGVPTIIASTRDVPVHTDHGVSTGQPGPRHLRPAPNDHPASAPLAARQLIDTFPGQITVGSAILDHRIEVNPLLPWIDSPDPQERRERCDQRSAHRQPA